MKRFLSLILVSLLTLSLTACGSSASDKNPAVADISSAILSSISVGETVALTDNTLPKQYLDLDVSKVAEYAVNIASSGALADEIAIFKATDKEAVSKIKEAINSRLSLVEEKFVDYVPAEMSKIENALILENGNYILLAIVEDTKTVEDKFNELFK